MAGGFLDRWSRRKAGEQLEPEKKLVEPTKQALVSDAEVKVPAEDVQDALPTMTLDDVEKIDRFAPDFSAFMQPGVDPAVQQAAMKKMFSDPHFNIMDGLDIYIDDYSKPDPIPLEMLKRMVQSDMLNIFRKDNVDEPEANTIASTDISASKEPTLPAPVQTDLTSTPIPIQEAGDQDPLSVDKKTS
ncbi:DUF3306 domain-containing protein [Polynucleobacter arcticus]|uniref:DUF3306 domain-containing protein n=1 Tax=Polynucleobacter arcticus TaxID=1743165 RepID=A0A6M9PLK2_9BURK|nr:DUF3306 domain-containing protein [Polynucleobacter arcticus]QKM60812.1 DUF3306 domain-containing protein [Polynucleobacter arcticus]